MKQRLAPALAAFALVTTFCLPAFASTDPPKFTEDGLELIDQSEWGLVYVEPGASLESYSQVKLVDTYVAFKKNWRRDQNRNSGEIRVTENDMERIKERLANEFKEVFTEVLTESGYPVVEDSGEDVLILRPAIINLDVTAPDTMRGAGSKTYAESAGEMTIYLEMYDSVTGDLLAKGMDRRADRDRGYMMWQSRVQNTAAAKQILKAWAEDIVKALDKAHGKS